MSRHLLALISSLVIFVFIGCGGGNDTVKEPIQTTSKPQDTNKNNGVNSTPIATFDNFRINRDTTYDGQLTATDADGDTLKYMIITQPQHGSVVIHDNGCFTYTPDAGYQGADTFSYKASDDISSCAVKIVTIDVCAESIQKPTAPTELIVNVVSTSVIKLSWKDNSNNEEGFAIYQDGKLIATTTANKTNKTICNLEEGTNYTFAVKAKNLAGTSTATTAQGKTKEVTAPPAAPTELKAKAIGETCLRLEWKDNADNESGYEIYQDGILVKTVLAGCHCATIGGLSAGTSYGFMVKAVNRLGSGDSGTISVKTKGGSSEPTTTSINKTYTYDQAGRVIKEDFNNGKYIEYTYDDNGNLINQNVVGGI